MRVQRHKAARKTLAFYKLAFGILPPFKVLLDGNFIAQAVRMAIEFKRLLPKLLFADAMPAGKTGVFFHVTDCCLEELRSLGPKGEKVVAEATSSGIGIIRCRHKHGHKEGTDASECIRLLVGPSNASKYVVATQDAGLRDAVRKVPGVPIILFSQNVMVLEPPSDTSRKHQGAKEAAKASVQPSELAMIAKTMAGRGGSSSSSNGSSLVGLKRPRSEGSDGDAGDSDAEGGAAGSDSDAGSDRALKLPFKKAPGSLPALLASAGIIGGKCRPQKPKKKKRKGPSGPNPLSAMKKKKQSQGPQGRGGHKKGADKPRRKRPAAAAAAGGGGNAGAGAREQRGPAGGE